MREGSLSKRFEKYRFFSGVHQEFAKQISLNYVYFYFDSKMSTFNCLIFFTPLYCHRQVHLLFKKYKASVQYFCL